MEEGESREEAGEWWARWRACHGNMEGECRQRVGELWEVRKTGGRRGGGCVPVKTGACAGEEEEDA